MFENFDFDVLNDPEFKEDSVREEIVLPILHSLGYSATGQHQITRSKSLLHPYVMIGSKRHPVYIIPDYLLKVDSIYGFVLDAKAPAESIYKSSNVEQVYSYAIHPDVRVSLYALCNGREFVVYDLFQVEPLLRFNVSQIEDCWEKLHNILSPKAVMKPELRDFLPDFGILASKTGYTKDIDWCFYDNEISMIIKVSDDLYTSDSGIDSGVEGEEVSPYFISLDYSSELLDEMLQFASDKTKTEVSVGLSCQPYRVRLSEPFKISVEAHLGSLQDGEHEQFIPFVVSKILPSVATIFLTDQT